MTQDLVKALSDELLAKVKVWAIEEERARAEKRRHDTIARIKELAGTVGVSITINGRRGRPPKAKVDAATAKSVK